MGFRLGLEVERLGKWLYKHGYPDKSIAWAISPDRGKIAHDCWTEYTGDNDSLPRGKRLTFKKIDDKSTIHIFLPDGDNEEEQPDSRQVVSDTALLPPELVERQRLLERRENALVARESQLQAWQDELRALDVDLRKTTGLSIKISRELDDRTTSIAGNLKLWEQHIKDSEVESIGHIAQMNALSADMDEVIGEKAKLAEKQAIATSVTYAFDKIMASYLLGKAKKFEDLPAETIADFQQYLIDRAERRYYKEMPDMVSDLGNRFIRMPDDVKSKFAESMIRWTVDNKPSMIKDIAAEYANAKRV